MKIISIIDSDRAYGKERANLLVDFILREQGAEVKILINKVADKSIRDEISAYNYYEIPFPRNLGGKKYWWKYVLNYFLTTIIVFRLFQKEKPDFILVPTEIALSYLYLPLLFSEAKIVFRCGDSPLVFRKKGLVARVYSVLWKSFVLRHIDIIVSNAKFIQKQLSDSGRIANEKDMLIYNFPPVRAIQEDNAIYKNHPNSLRIGYIGRIVADKGVRELIKAVTSLNQRGEKVMAYICGDTSVDEAYFEEISAISDSSIEYVGLIKDLDKFYEHVDLVCIPSIYAEPMANVVSEAKYHRKAVVIFNLGGMPEIVEHKKNGYICPEVTVDSLTEGIIYYLENPDMVKEHGNNAYMSIEDLGLTKKVFLGKWVSVFS